MIISINQVHFCLIEMNLLPVIKRENFRSLVHEAAIVSVRIYLDTAAVIKRTLFLISILNEALPI